MPDEKKPEPKTQEEIKKEAVATTAPMYNKPQIAPDGHVVLSQEDIDARQ